MQRLPILLSALVLGCLGSEAKVKPGSMFTDNMVLLQSTEVPLHGTAKPGSIVTVNTSWGATAAATADAKTGAWRCTVATPAGSFEPRTVTFSDGDGSPAVLSNVLIGEVWLASGQSNMQMPLKGFSGCCVEGGYDEIASSASYADKVHFYMVPLTQSFTPLDTVAGSWQIPSPKTSQEFSALAWHFAKRMADVLEVPVGIVNAAYGGARVESWLPRDILETYPDESLEPARVNKMVHYHRPLLMYNAMFNPVKDFGYRGIIWYQGCSNVGKHDTYADRLCDMVTRWRAEIGRGDIPFYAVELAPYLFSNDNQSNSGPRLRDAQWEAVGRLANADMICINDLTYPHERYNIHPSQKAGVGKRLCDLALNRTYGRSEFLAGSPKYKGYKVKDGAVWVAIDSPNGGICRNTDIQGFEVAGEDRVFHPAENVWLNWRTNEMVVSSKEVPEPVAVRYCWRDFQIGTLHGGNFLPLIPFRTDTW